MATRTLQSSGVQFTDQRNFYLSPRVTQELWPSVMPFTTVISQGNVKSPGEMEDTIFKLFEHRNPWRRQYFDNNGDSVTIGTNDADSSEITIDGIVGLNSTVDASYIGLECEVWDSTETTLRGTILVTSVPSSTGIKVRNLDGATAIATVDNDRYVVVGNAHGEGASSPEAWADDLHMAWNSTQEFRTPYEISRKLRKAALRGELKELDRLKKQKAGEHKMQKEKAFLYGRNPVGTNLDPDSADSFTDASGNGANWRTDANGNVVRTTMGIFTAIDKYGNSSGEDQNIFSYAEGAFTWKNYVAITEKMFQYLPNSGFKRAFCGRGAMSIWAVWGTDGIGGRSGWQVQLSPYKKDRLGFNFRTLETPHGVLQLIPTPAIDRGRNNWMLVIDHDDLWHAMYERPEFRQNIKTDNAPSLQKDEYWSDEGLGITLIEKHSVIKFT